MPTGYSRSPKLLRGALVEFSERFLGPVPNIIVFQYNPETVTRTLQPWQPQPQQGASGTAGAASGELSPPCMAQPFDPPETFDLPLELDAADALEEPESHSVAVLSGVADRIAALELLLYPSEGSLLGGLLGVASASVSVSAGGVSLSGSAGGGVDEVPRTTAPVVLFVWGPGRIVPVRLTSFSVEEQAYSPTLYPIRAKVTVGLRVLTSECFPEPRSLSQKLAVAAYEFTKKQKQALGAANLANSVESILGMLPF